MSRSVKKGPFISVKLLKKVEEMKSKLDEYKLELPEKVQKYLAGELSYKKLFTEGTGDIE